ncbi:hypothetical protein DNTS_015077 [Danionella cerebrum]|uniref:Uncharacterized protein n=1 Tax=Danionella cerebrum TaxID=2873325 RepID=A0A553Q0A3_9TELE|nr:hypothetical protein DNTS_015077 [Danionella translucida]
MNQSLVQISAGACSSSHSGKETCLTHSLNPLLWVSPCPFDPLDLKEASAAAVPLRSLGDPELMMVLTHWISKQPQNSFEPPLRLGLGPNVAWLARMFSRI